MANSPVRRRAAQPQSPSLAVKEENDPKTVHATTPPSTQPKVLPIVLKLLSSTNGRDKIYRTIQYVCRLLGSAFNVERLLALSVAVGQGRKLFRVGKPIEHIQTIVNNVKGEGDVAIRAGVALKAVGYGGWLILDMLQWLQAVKVIDLSKPTMEWINSYAPRLWLLGILASLFTNGYKAKAKLPCQLNDLQREAYEGTQDAIDLIIPASQAGLVSAPPSLVGLAGTITSLMGLYSLIK